MTRDELCVLVADVDTRRFTLEDAERQGEEWTVYLYEHRSGVTYCVADYAAFRAYYAYLPAAWITHQPRLDRTGGGVSATDATLTRSALLHMLTEDDASASRRLCAFHVFYDADDDDRYMAVFAEPGGSQGERSACDAGVPAAF